MDSSHLVKKLTLLFKQNANKAIAEKQSAYMRHLFPFFGIPKPLRSVLEKPLYKEYAPSAPIELCQILQALWKKEEREFQYFALEYAWAHRKLWDRSLLPCFELCIREKSWWDTVDDLAGNCVGEYLKCFPDEIFKMDHWIEDSTLWIRRSALIFQLKYKNKTDEERLFDYCEKTMHESDFFIRKAIGWALRQYSKTSPIAVQKFIVRNERNLSPLSKKEGSKYLPS